MPSARRESINVNLDAYNVGDQARELARLMQEKADREFAANLQRQIEQEQEQATSPRATAPRNVDDSRSAAGPIRNNNRRRSRQTPPPSIVLLIHNRPATSGRRNVVHVDESDNLAESPSNSNDNDDADSDDDLSGNDDGDYEVNHIAQPFQDNDRSMYARELEVDYHNSMPSTSAGAAAAYNPPARVGKPNGKWGDCTLCLEVPIEPRGCNACRQIIGCMKCIKDWYSTAEHPSCPLCRRKWTRQPDISMMPVIEQRRRFLARSRARSQQHILS
uniref:RING-type domain-containing protein n=1 Tax=Caenorhabditis japonica TaxID=281687 RepID=A0A8R1DNG6_CAEJA